MLDPGFDSLSAIHDVPDDSKNVSPERALWIAVIANTWLDAFSRSLATIKTNDRTCDPEQVRGEARRWLILDFGDWKKDRETVCDLADIDQVMLRNAARRKLAELKKAESENRTAEIVSLDTMFAALLESEATMDAQELDKALAALAALEAEAA